MRLDNKKKMPRKRLNNRRRRKRKKPKPKPEQTEQNKFSCMICFERFDNEQRVDKEHMGCGCAGELCKLCWLKDWDARSKLVERDIGERSINTNWDAGELYPILKERFLSDKRDELFAMSRLSCSDEIKASLTDGLRDVYMWRNSCWMRDCAFCKKTCLWHFDAHPIRCCECCGKPELHAPFTSFNNNDETDVEFEAPAE